MHMVFAERLLAIAVFAKSIKVLGWQPGAPNTRDHDFPEKKRPDFFEIHRTIDNTMSSVDLCNHAFGFYRTFTSQRSVGKVNENAWMAARGPKIPGARFSGKKSFFFEIQRTIDTSMGSAASKLCIWSLRNLH